MEKANDDKTPATKGDVRQIVGEAVDAVLQGMDKLWGKIDTRFDKMDSRLHKVESDVHFIKDNAQGLDAELAMKPTNKRVNDLEKKVDKYHPETKVL